MPEGDNVFRSARALHQTLAGQVLRKTDFRVPRLATADLSGQTVREVVPRGKHILMRTDAGWTLHTHFMMDGEWRIHPRRGGFSSHEVRVVLETDTHSVVGVNLPVVELLKTEHEDQVVGHLGPDVLGPDWDPAEAQRRLVADPTREVADALIDQRVMAGPGNIYKNEALFLSGVHPRMKCGDLKAPERLVNLMRRLMVENRDRPTRITTGDRRDKLWVWGRTGRPCRRCGTPIQMDGSGMRQTWWCPHCQPASASSSARSSD